MTNTAIEVAHLPNVTDCGSTAPSSTGFQMNEFNPHEAQFDMSLFIDNYEVSSVRTTYVDIAFNVPTEVLDAHDIYHAVWAEAIVDRVGYLHHYVIRPCAQLWPDHLHGKAIDRRNRSLGDCADYSWGGWAPGSDVLSAPSWAGHPFGRAVGIVSFIANIHYDNPSGQSGIIDNSGVRVWYTPTLRQHHMEAIATTRTSINRDIVIPPGLRRWFLTRECLLDVRDRETGEPAELHLVGVGYHAHLLGREMYTEYWPVGEEVSFDLASARVWHFDDQGQRIILNWNVSLRSGDRLQTTCVMDSSGRSDNTIFGRETTDEMCWAQFSGWPSTPNGIESVCTGSVWSGMFADNEPGFSIATRHPEAEARDVWDGTDLTTAGGPLRLQGRPPVVIEDCDDANARICAVLTGFLANEPNFSCTAPLSDVQAVIEMFGSRPMSSAMLGSSMLDVCCTTACMGLCAEEPQCTVDNSMPTVPPPQAPVPESWAGLQVRSLHGCGEATGSANDADADDSTAQRQSRCINVVCMVVSSIVTLWQVERA